MKTSHCLVGPTLATAGAIIAGAATYALLEYPVFPYLGTKPGEDQAALPGDDLISDGLQSTRAIAMLAPPEAIWPYPERKLRALAKRSTDVGGWQVASIDPGR